MKNSDWADKGFILEIIVVALASLIFWMTGKRNEGFWYNLVWISLGVLVIIMLTIILIYFKSKEKKVKSFKKRR